MKQVVNFRQLYTPIQPTAMVDENVIYREFLPDERLQNFIYCYWQLKTTQELPNGFNYNVVADGCMDVFFDLDDLSDSSVMGFCRQNMEFGLGQTFNYAGIRFLPAMFPTLFNINASELANRSEQLNLVLPSLSDYILRRFHPYHTLAELKLLLDTFFLQYLSQNELQNDARLYNAVQHIMDKYSTVFVEKDLHKELSPRHLRRIFEFYIGDTPKTFSRVVRFQHMLSANPSGESFRKEKPFFDAGYYDQTHFIKEFKLFYGMAPKKVFV